MLGESQSSTCKIRGLFPFLRDFAGECVRRSHSFIVSLYNGIYLFYCLIWCVLHLVALNETENVKWQRFLVCVVTVPSLPCYDYNIKSYYNLIMFFCVGSFVKRKTMGKAFLSWFHSHTFSQTQLTRKQSPLFTPRVYPKSAYHHNHSLLSASSSNSGHCHDDNRQVSLMDDNAQVKGVFL